MHGPAAAQIQAALELEEVEVHSYTTQVVAGTRYRLKIRHGDSFLHCEVIKPLPHTNSPPFIVPGTVAHGKSETDGF